MELQLGQILTQAVAFLLMLWVLKRWAWKPLLEHLEERKQKIAGEFQRAESVNQEAEALRLDYENRLSELHKEARVKLQEAIDEGRHIAEEIRQKSQQQAKELLSHAQQQAENELIASKIKLKKEIVEICMSATEKMLGERLTQGVQEELVSKFIEEVEFK